MKSFATRGHALVASEGHGTGHRLQPQGGEGHPWGHGTLQDRFDAVRPLFTNVQSVLDVGCASRHGRPDWIHGLIAKVVPELVGIDIDAATLTELRTQGYDVREADACGFELGRTFDLVFAGELIEHLDDVHGFLASARAHLKEGGQLVLTTPNAFYVGNFVYRLGGHAQVHAEHTCWYCEDTLRQVLQRNGFAPPEIYFSGHSSPTLMRKMATFMSRLLLPPRLAFDTLVAAARSADYDSRSNLDSPG